MLESLHAILIQYGLLGLFLGSFLSSTVFFPIPIEPLILATIPFLNLYLVVLVAAVGSTLGTCVNYGVGLLLGRKFVEKYVRKDKILKAQKLMNKYGWSGLLIILAIPIPGVPVDPITIFPGLAKMRFKEFFVVVFVGKLIKYSIFVGLFSELMHLLG